MSKSLFAYANVKTSAKICYAPVFGTYIIKDKIISLHM